MSVCMCLSVYECMHESVRECVCVRISVCMSLCEYELSFLADCINQENSYSWFIRVNRDSLIEHRES